LPLDKYDQKDLFNLTINSSGDFNMGTLTDNHLKKLKDLINSKFESVDRNFEKIDSKFEKVFEEFIAVKKVIIVDITLINFGQVFRFTENK
jgi:hypothetical protein